MLLEKLKLADVRYEDEGAKAVLTFLDEERGEIREVNFNTKDYDEDKKEFIDNPEKKEKVEEWCQKYFNLNFNELSKAVGEEHDIYAYDRFNSLWEVQQVKKFDKDMEGQIVEGIITEVLVDDIGIHIRYDYEEETYNSNMNYAEYMEALQKWFKNPQKKVKQEERFKKKFHVDIEDKDSLIGTKIMVEVKVFNGNVFGDIKTLPKPKK